MNMNCWTPLEISLLFSFRLFFHLKCLWTAMYLKKMYQSVQMLLLYKDRVIKLLGRRVSYLCGIFIRIFSTLSTTVDTKYHVAVLWKNGGGCILLVSWSDLTLLIILIVCHCVHNQNSWIVNELHLLGVT